MWGGPLRRGHVAHFPPAKVIVVYSRVRWGWILEVLSTVDDRSTPVRRLEETKHPCSGWHRGPRMV